MTTVNSLLEMLRRRSLGVSLALSLLSAACGGEDEDPIDGNNEPDATGTQGDDAGKDGSSPAKDGAPIDNGPSNGSDAGEVKTDAGGGGAADDLFKGPPECPEGASAVVRLQGTIDGKQISYEKTGVSSMLAADRLYTVDNFETTPPVPYIRLVWQGAMTTFAAGATVKLADGWLDFTSSQAGGQGNFCIVAGRLGAAPTGTQPSKGSRFFFEVTGVKAREGSSYTCAGPELPAKIKGCLYRLN